VGDGFVEVTNDHVAVLTDMAIPSDQIDEAKAEEARRRAEARLAEQIDDEETATVHAALANSMAQLAVKRRRHK
jgi:F-type H+-transporting ATPase subunit epsilon